MDISNVSNWIICKGDNKDLFEVGLNSEKEPICIHLILGALYNDWSDGRGINLTAKMRDQLNLKPREPLCIDSVDIIDPKAIAAIMDIFTNSSAHPELKFRKITFEPVASRKEL